MKRYKWDDQLSDEANRLLAAIFDVIEGEWNSGEDAIKDEFKPLVIELIEATKDEWR